MIKKESWLNIDDAALIAYFVVVETSKTKMHVNLNCGPLKTLIRGIWILCSHKICVRLYPNVFYFIFYMQII